MLPRVAFEYGQTWWARATTFSAASRSAPGMVTSSATDRPKAPFSCAPSDTSATTSLSVVSTPSATATALSAEWKHAA